MGWGQASVIERKDRRASTALVLAEPACFGSHRIPQTHRAHDPSAAGNTHVSRSGEARPQPRQAPYKLDTVGGWLQGWGMGTAHTAISGLRCNSWIIFHHPPRAHREVSNQLEVHSQVDSLTCHATQSAARVEVRVRMPGRKRGARKGMCSHFEFEGLQRLHCPAGLG